MWFVTYWHYQKHSNWLQRSVNRSCDKIRLKGKLNANSFTMHLTHDVTLSINFRKTIPNDLTGLVYLQCCHIAYFFMLSNFSKIRIEIQISFIWIREKWHATLVVFSSFGNFSELFQKTKKRSQFGTLFFTIFWKKFLKFYN
jgi:hypothetical protein